MDTALSVEGLRVWRGRSEIVRSIDLTIPSGQVVALLGANGAGKTTLIEGLLGHLPTKAEKFELFGKDVRGAKPWDMVRGGFVVVPQDRYLFTDMSVAENLAVAARRAGRRQDRSFELEELYDLFPRLSERQGQYAGTLSGGERSMLAIARGLALQPRVLVLDEPSLGLAPIVIDLIMSTIKRIAQSGLPILLVEQNVNQTLAMSSWGYVLESGEITASNDSDSLLGSDVILSGYLAVDVESAEGGS
ncbi:branched-chain amino acid transport system ATP-binding protein [Nocardioides salarius]|uniref:Branched-chain amino acid transport system ATP-binding protein n=1 Tax=Nocardioides salarius TaxID=374513 RepID=A0ABS2MA66_9ACTN|nr:ABC transporter ATP-binding protein [Nocardioides salarius]MBM7508074.1 branched-chain amino acid transport system ATP-binding protein [Nocardioides salarius]